MGIRFQCHHCEQELHVKDFQAGKRGKCPKCHGKFRVPLQDHPSSLPLEEPRAPSLQTQAASTSQPAPTGASVEPSPVPGAASSQAPTDNSSAPQISTAEVAHEQPPVPTPSSASGENSTATLAPPTPPPPAAPLTPSALQENPTASWFIRPESGGQFGPADQSTMLQWLTENRISPGALVWREGWQDWQPASGVLADYFASIPAFQTSTNGGVPASTSSAQSAPPPSSPVVGGSGEMKQLKRRNKKRQNYKIMIISLIVIAVVLVTALITVLVLQGSGS
ncbi:DUF4339 domain-containing protein [Aureliella helgolandensis]|uniref:GYF domain-containing protein n=1 Tax=Aureliella helgolandensis TaxID=2527968 RepID=A0A518G6W3_9BACT|nr:DUF4339 domain-containing protein [Aureliella helgolandensis]QDV24316.1 hypothetical protein Q31a_26320 [Aureliella helgolandensis]